MTSSGARRLPGPTLKVRSAMISRPKDANNVQSVIEHYVKLYKLIGSPGYPAADAYLHERLGQSVRRSYRPQGTARQMVAIAADGNRSPLLGQIKVPTQIIHGRDDPLVPVEAGHDLAAKIRAPRSTSSAAWAPTCRRRCGHGSSPASRARPNGRSQAATRQGSGACVRRCVESLGPVGNPSRRTCASPNLPASSLWQRASLRQFGPWSSIIPPTHGSAAFAVHGWPSSYVL